MAEYADQWGELRSFVQQGDRNPYELERLVDALGEQRERGMEYALTHWAEPADTTLVELRRRHAFELFLGAPIASFPKGSYGSYSVEVCLGMDQLGERLGEVEDGRRSLSLDQLDAFCCIPLEPEMVAPLIEALSAENQVYWLDKTQPDEQDLYVSPDGAIMLRERALLRDNEYLLSHHYTLLNEQRTLYHALNDLFFDRMEDDYLQDLLDNYVDDTLEEQPEEVAHKLALIEDKSVRNRFFFNGLGNPDLMVFHRGPAELKSKREGVWRVAEIEDQCQQDFFSFVCYIPASQT